MLVETGADGSGEPTGDKYESHTSVADTSIIFADKRLLFIKTEEVPLRGKSSRSGVGLAFETSTANRMAMAVPLEKAAVALPCWPRQVQVAIVLDRRACRVGLCVDERDSTVRATACDVRCPLARCPWTRT